MLQTAIEIEHSTIPLYLSALFGLKLEPQYAGPRKVLVSILHEEMVHLAVACNLKIAFGGTPYLAF